MTTAADGTYLFEGLLPGDYIVVITPPAGFGVAPQDAATMTRLTTTSRRLLVRAALSHSVQGRTSTPLMSVWSSCRPLSRGARVRTIQQRHSTQMGYRSAHRRPNTQDPLRVRRLHCKNRLLRLPRRWRRLVQTATCSARLPSRSWRSVARCSSALAASATKKSSKLGFSATTTSDLAQRYCISAPTACIDSQSSLATWTSSPPVVEPTLLR